MPRIEARAWRSFQATGQQRSGEALTGSVNGITQRGDDKAFAVAIFRRIKGFAEYGFTPSHAASFALLVQASGWIQCAERVAFLAALLNFQPTGFCRPSQQVQDARRHGVKLRDAPLDEEIVELSEAPEGQEIGWDCASLGPFLRRDPVALFFVRQAAAPAKTAVWSRPEASSPCASSRKPPVEPCLYL